MELHDFHSILEVLTGFNLAYAGSKKFREGVDGTILSINNASTAKIELTKMVLLSESKVVGLEPKITKKISELTELFEKEDQKIRVRERHARRFPNSLKSLFLSSAIFCLIIMILAGYKHVSSRDGLYDSIFILYTLNFAFLFNFFLFCRSFTPRFIKSPFKPTLVLLFYALLVIFSIFYFNY